MSVLYQAIRILVPVGICIYIAGKLKKGRVNTHDMLFLRDFWLFPTFFPGLQTGWRNCWEFPPAGI